MGANPAKQYPDRYTWSHPLASGVIAHQDGAVSRLVDWNGLDADLTTDKDRERAWERMSTALAGLEVGYCAEFHWWREWDDQLALRYREHGEQMVRGGEFAQAIRDAQADHLAQYAMSNETAVVLTKLPRTSQGWLGLFSPKAALSQQGKDAIALDEQAQRLAAALPGGSLSDADAFLNRIQQSYDRDRFMRSVPPSWAAGELLTDSLLACAPSEVAVGSDNHLAVNGHASKSLFVYHYPDAAPSWFLGLASLSIPMHVVHVVIPVDTRTAMRKSEKESRLATGMMSERGIEQQDTQLGDMAAYRQFVATNNLRVFYNAYIIVLHGSPEELKAHTRTIKDCIESAGGQVRDQAYIQLPYFRVSQPGQGYRVPKTREDHLLQVANMLPVQVFKSGEITEPESLRLGESGQLVGFNYSKQKIGHSFTVAMTGGGKGVDKVATIAETYPFGIDWYIAEIGQSYRWVVESFGGVYTRLDPTDSVINPLPPYSLVPPLDDAHALPLDAFIAGQTISALAFLLTDGRTALTVHESKAGQDALQFVYSMPAKGHRLAPTLPEYLAALREDLFDHEQQALAAKAMADNLESFLGTTEGRIFQREDNLVFSQGITGVDLKDIDRANPKLLKFYLVFIALKFSQLAFARRTPAVVLLDEMHKFVAIAPEVMGRLISEIARMGRKEAAAIDIVTQGISEIDVIENEVLNSMRLRSLLYRPDEHETIAGRIHMPPGVLANWRSWKDPTNFDWRPAIRSIGDEFYHLNLRFPSLLLDLASTSPNDLTLKDTISSMTTDPFQRIELLKEFRRKS